MSDIDLDAYFRRIGYAGPREPSLDLLRNICRLHTQVIPFENIDPLLERPLGLDVAALQAKLVHAKRGGYCFEHNSLLQHVLTALGLKVRSYGARVVLNQPEGGVPPRTHMLLRVEIDDESHIADVGFGGLTPTGPVLFETGCERATPHETYRIMEAGPEFELEARVAGVWTKLYRFHVVEHVAVDHEVANFYVERSPQSFFRNAIVAARASSDGRYALLNDRLTFHCLDGTRDVQTLPNAAGLNEVLADVFGIDVPDPAALAAVFDRLMGARKA